MKIVFILDDGQRVDFASLTGLAHPDIKTKAEALKFVGAAMYTDERIKGFELEE